MGEGERKKGKERRTAEGEGDENGRRRRWRRRAGEEKESLEKKKKKKKKRRGRRRWRTEEEAAEQRRRCPQSPLISCIPPDISALFSPCSVADFVNNKVSILSKIEPFLENDTCQFLQEANITTERKDRLIWMPADSGNFSFKEAYKLLTWIPGHFPISKFIWNHKIPKKISIFIWKLLNAFLPFDDILVRFGYSLASKCPVCNHVDSLEHFFFHCKLAKTIWNHSAGLVGFNLCNIHNLVQVFFLFWNCDDLPLNQRIICGLLPSLTCWELWKARNSYLHDQKSFCSSQICISVVDSLNLSIAANLGIPNTRQHSQSHFQYLLALPRPPPKPTISIMYWDFPESGFVKVNVDATWTSQSASIAVIVRDEIGTPILIRSESTTALSPLEAEMRAILLACQVCIPLYPNLTIESDSHQAVQMINNPSCSKWKLFSLASHVKAMLSSVSLRHIYRECNSVADEIAQHYPSLNFASPIHLQSLPSLIRGRIIMDIRHSPYVRIQKVRVKERWYC